MDLIIKLKILCPQLLSQKSLDSKGASVVHVVDHLHVYCEFLGSILSITKKKIGHINVLIIKNYDTVTETSVVKIKIMIITMEISLQDEINRKLQLYSCN